MRPGPNPHFARAVLAYLWNQVEHGTGCPTGMAYAAHAGFESEPALRIWEEKVRGTQYEFNRREVAEKAAVVIGYAMTEKQGGSDLRETQTTAVFSHSADYHGATAHWYELTGHKWFCSVPQSDGFFTLAKVGGGVTCFFLPRTLPDGSYNRFFIQRLKDKAGNKSNASSEVEFSGTLAIRVGAEGGGIREIISHSHLTRLDFAVGSAGLMRQALTLALNHTGTRNGFGMPLAKLPMMTNVLADMAIEVEAATLMALRVAKATDQMGTDAQQERLRTRGNAHRQVLQLLACTGDSQRGFAMPRRKRVHRRESDGPHLSRGAAQQRVGRYGEHDVHGRAAGTPQEPRLPGGPDGRVPGSPRSVQTV